MRGILSIIIGASIVLSSFFLMRKELVRANRENRRSFNSLNDENVNQVMQYLRKIEKELDDLNASYYEIVSDLEGKYSVHDKEIEILQERLEAIKIYKPRKTDSVGAIDRRTKSSHLRNDPRSSEVDEQELICQNAVRLKQEGLSISQIAKELNIGIGELQLLLKTKR